MGHENKDIRKLISNTIASQKSHPAHKELMRNLIKYFFNLQHNNFDNMDLVSGKNNANTPKIIMQIIVPTSLWEGCRIWGITSPWSSVSHCIFTEIMLDIIIHNKYTCLNKLILFRKLKYVASKSLKYVALVYCYHHNFACKNMTEIFHISLILM